MVEQFLQFASQHLLIAAFVAGVLVHHLASRRDDQGRRDRYQLKLLDDTASLVEENAELQVVTMDEGPNLGLVVWSININGDDPDAPLLVVGGDFLQHGQFLDTGLAPGGPEIEDQRSRAYFLTAVKIRGRQYRAARAEALRRRRMAHLPRTRDSAPTPRGLFSGMLLS